MNNLNKNILDKTTFLYGIVKKITNCGNVINLGDKINRLRTERKLSLEKLAEQLNIAKSILWKYEKNQIVPSAETIKKMAV
jgi:ribosome-binding protein aMBF1 (putative translation factor)